MTGQTILLNKPFRVLSQFSDRDNLEDPRPRLSSLLSAPGYKVAGRLDFDSEGLIILTRDGKLQQKIINPKYRCWKSYWVQVEGRIDQDACNILARGVALKDGVTRPARANLINQPKIWPRYPPVRVRKTVSDSWLKLSIFEGRNRQIRRMTAALGFPTLRLIRVSIGPWRLDELEPGDFRLEHSP